MENLKRWLLCMAGRHDWAEFQIYGGPTIVFCVHCGTRDE